MAIELSAYSKKKPLAILLAIIAVAIVLVFYLRQDLQRSIMELGRIQMLSQTLKCDTTRFGQEVLQSRLRPNDDIRLLVAFNERPSNDTRDYLAQQGVAIHLNTWIFDYLVADTKVDRLCFLAELPGIERISLGT